MHYGLQLNRVLLPAEDLSDFVGKDVAQKVTSGAGQSIKDNSIYNWKKLSGVDLKMGGEWAAALYDRAIPNFLNKYGKKWGIKTGQTEVSTSTPGSLRYEIVDPQGNVQDAFRNRQGAEDAVEGYQAAHHGPGKWRVRDTGTTDKVHSIEITPSMKKSVLHEGQPIARAEEPVSETAQG